MHPEIDVEVFWLACLVTQVPRVGISVGSRVDVETMNRAVDAHAMRPVIDRVFPFAEAKSAFAYYDGRNVFSKIVIQHS